MAEYHPTSTRDQSRLHQFGKKVLAGIFLGDALIAVRIWKGGDILIADLEEVETIDASEIYPRRVNAKEVLISQKGDKFVFPMAEMVHQNCQEETRNPRTHSKAVTNRME